MTTLFQINIITHALNLFNAQSNSPIQSDTCSVRPASMPFPYVNSD